jgi:hypothetical protein
MQILFCLPGNSFSSHFLLSWSMLIDSCYKKNINIVLAPGVASSLSLARSKSLGYTALGGANQLPFQGKIEYDFIMFLDSDILFKPDDFFTLLESPHDITSGLYMHNDNKNYSTCQKWDTDYFLKNGSFEYMTPTALEAYKKNALSKYMPIAFTGLGFTLMRKGVLEKLSYPIFWADIQTIPSTDSTKPDAVEIPSDEMAFFLNLKKAGITSYVDTSIRVGHEKLVVL